MGIFRKNGIASDVIAREMTAPLLYVCCSMYIANMEKVIEKNLAIIFQYSSKKLVMIKAELAEKMITEMNNPIFPNLSKKIKNSDNNERNIFIRAQCLSKKDAIVIIGKVKIILAARLLHRANGENTLVCVILSQRS